MRRKLIGLIIAAASVSMFASMAPAMAVAEVAVPGSFQAGFALTTVVVPAGQDLTFANFDVQSHNIVSDKLDSHGKPIFSSAAIGAGAYETVNGVPALKPGTYTFYCALHSSSMRASLIIQ